MRVPATGLAAVAILVAACTSGNAPPSDKPQPTRQRAPVPGPDEPLSVKREDALCRSLAAIVGNEPAALDGRIVAPAMQGCTVEVDCYPRAQHVCRSAESRTGPDGPLALRFLEVSGERQVVWRYGGSHQRPGVSLKIEEDIGRSANYLRLAGLTLR